MNVSFGYTTPHRMYDAMWAMATILNRTKGLDQFAYGDNEKFSEIMNIANAINFPGLSVRIF